MDGGETRSLDNEARRGLAAMLPVRTRVVPSGSRKHSTVNTKALVVYEETRERRRDCRQTLRITYRGDESIVGAMPSGEELKNASRIGHSGFRWTSDEKPERS
jgi:hypothetical protein